MASAGSPPDPDTDNAQVVAATERALGFAIPEPCIAGVVANVRLLADHARVLRQTEPAR